MTIADVTPALLAAGCNPLGFAVGERGRASDAFVLLRQNNRWEVFYTERGVDSEPIFTHASEDMACEYFVNLVGSQTHWHLVGWFGDEAAVRRYEDEVRALGVKPIRNDIPNFRHAGDPRFRVFVLGKDIFAMRSRFPELPITDNGRD